MSTGLYSTSLIERSFLAQAYVLYLKENKKNDVRGDKFAPPFEVELVNSLKCE